MNHIKTIITTFILFVAASNLVATNYTVSNATDLKSKLTTIVAGDTLFVASGTYALSSSISLTKNGTSSSRICVMAANLSNRPILDFAGTSTGTQGISLQGDYWHIKGLKICNAGDNGMHLEKSALNNIVEFCDFYRNEDTGLQIDDAASNNLIKNCDSYFNADATLENADGFACKMDAGTGNTFEGCRAWRNLDDGWDGYLRGADNITTTYINCWAFRNGYNESDAAGVGDGNGFKTGGSDDKDLKHNGIYKNCIAAYNRVDGFDHNSNRGNVTLHNCLATGNNTNMGFGSTNPVNSLTIKNTVVIGSTGNLSGTTTDISHNSWNLSVTANASDYNSILLDAMDDARGVDGSLPTNLFKIVASSDLIDKGINVGLAFSGTAPDLGPDEYVSVSQPTLTLTSGLSTQTVNQGTAISSIVYTWGGNATDVTVTGLPATITPTKNSTNKTVTISGTPTSAQTINYTVTTTPTGAAKTGTITVNAAVPPSLTLTSGTATQTAYTGSPIVQLVYTWGGGATDVTIGTLPAGVSPVKNPTNKTITISGTPTTAGAVTFAVTTVGGSGSAISLSNTITVNNPTTLSQPSSVSATATTSSVTLNWTPIANATGYTINLCSTPTSGGDQILFHETFNGSTAGNVVYDNASKYISVKNSATCTTTGLINLANSTIYFNNIAGLNQSNIKLYIKYKWNAPGAGSGSVKLNDIASGSNGSSSVPISKLFSFDKNAVGWQEITLDFPIAADLIATDGTTDKLCIRSDSSGDVDIDEIKIYIEGGGTPAPTCTEYPVSGGSTNSYTITGLTNNVSYSYQLKANSTNPAFSNGAYSTAKTITTGTTTSCSMAEANATLLQTTDELIVQGVEVNSIQIYAVQGSKITSAEASQTITISNLAKGIYVAVITTKEGCFSKKISIQ
jgi:hypothetical protein